MQIVRLPEINDAAHRQRSVFGRKKPRKRSHALQVQEIGAGDGASVRLFYFGTVVSKRHSWYLFSDWKAGWSTSLLKSSSSLAMFGYGRRHTQTQALFEAGLLLATALGGC